MKIAATLRADRGTRPIGETRMKIAAKLRADRGIRPIGETR